MSDYETKVNADGIPVKSERVQKAEEWTDSVMGAWDDEEAMYNIFDSIPMDYEDEPFKFRKPSNLPGREEIESETGEVPAYSFRGIMDALYPGSYEAIEGFMDEYGDDITMLAQGPTAIAGGAAGYKLGKKILDKGTKIGFRKGVQSEFKRNITKGALNDLKSTMRGFEPNTVAWKKGLDDWLKKNPQYRELVERHMALYRNYESKLKRPDITDIIKKQVAAKQVTTPRPGVVDDFYDFTGPGPKSTKPLAPNEIGIRRYIEDFKAGRVDKWGNPISKKGFRKFVLNPGTSPITTRPTAKQPWTRGGMVDAKLNERWMKTVNSMLDRNEALRQKFERIIPRRLDWQGGRGGSGGFQDLNREIHRKFGDTASSYRMSNDIIHDIRKITWNTPEHQVLDKVGKLKRKFGIDNDLIGRVFERIEKVRKQEKANRKILSRRSSEGYFDE